MDHILAEEVLPSHDFLWRPLADMGTQLAAQDLLTPEAGCYAAGSCCRSLGGWFQLGAAVVPPVLPIASRLAGRYRASDPGPDRSNGYNSGGMHGLCF
jgi:hypothetical protein